MSERSKGEPVIRRRDPLNEAPKPETKEGNLADDPSLLDPKPLITAKREGITVHREGTTYSSVAVSIMRCTNIQCRIETFKGGPLMPFHSCPVCIQPGVGSAGGST